MRHGDVPHPPACREAAAYLYRDEASWAAMGTSLANRSGPVTLGSVGLTGRALTSGAPGGAKENWFEPLEPDQTGSLVQVEFEASAGKLGRLEVPSVTFDRRERVRRRDGLVVDEVVVLFG